MIFNLYGNGEKYMKKQLLFNTEDYYYKLDENGELTYDEYGDNYDGDGAQWEFEDIIEELDDEKYKTEARRFAKVKIYPNLGLWDGRRHGYAYEDSFKEAFEHCLIRGDMMIEVMKTGKHTVKVKVAHHDGTNYYTLKDS